MENGIVNKNPKRRRLVLSDSDHDDEIGTVEVRNFKILLPNGTSVELTLSSGENEMHFGKFLSLIREKYLETHKRRESMKNEINWNANSLFLEDALDTKIRKVIQLRNYRPHKCHLFRLNDGSSEVPETFENMWDLTPDTDLLLELPEEYSFEAAIADLIDNALQAVWFNGENKRIIRVHVSNNRISIFDNGSGMDGSDENSLVKWGKMGSSLHKLLKSQAIGGKPPYLMPCFGMFGYGGPIASMHLGGRIRVSSKTKHVKKVYMLHLQREALLNRSNSAWKTNGGIREPLKDEIAISDGSFTRVDIYEPKIKDVDIKKLQCHLKDIYFPYIQNDDLSGRGETITPIDFQINGDDLTGIQGGEVATTNLHSCNGPEFVLQLHMSIVQDHDGSSELQQANARLRFVYFPFKEEKESIERILENLKKDDYMIKENFQNFSRVSIRRLGRLLPDARWTFLPFMDFRNKRVSNNTASILKRCSMRVKCYIETDAGFKPTQSKMDLAHHSPFTIALKNLGNKISDKETDVSIEIRKATTILNPSRLEKEYQDWILQMHRHYDEEADAGQDEPTIVVSPPITEALCISKDVVRVHRVLKRKEKMWSHGQRIKVLKGACVGFNNNNVYATIEYFLLEGFDGEPGGDAWIICRPVHIPEENGCSVVDEENPTLNIGSSFYLPISVIDNKKLVPVESIEWERQLNKIQHQSRACIDSPSPNHYNQRQVDVVDTRVTRKSSHGVGNYKLLTDDQSPELDVRVGSTFPTLTIGSYDIHGNRTPFQKIPDVTVKLQAAEDLYFDVHGLNTRLSNDKMIFQIMDAMVKSSELDKIRPNYRTTLIIASINVPFSLSFPCRVFPGYVKHVKPKPAIREDELLPGFIFKELMLEMFDSYKNHVSEGTEVTISVAGFELLNHCSRYKVDDEGKVDVSGLLKLTAGYGENASISVVSRNRTIFKQEFSIAQRSLMIASKVPEFCVAGDHLRNLEFEIVNIDGDVDTKIHHDDQDCQFHMLTIKSDSFSAGESIRYTFKHGRCTIPLLRVPEFEGTFCFEASHSQYTELCLAVEVQVIKPLNAKDVSQSQFLSPDKNRLPLQELSPLQHESNLMISVLKSKDKKLDDIKIKNFEEVLNDLYKQKADTEQEMLILQDNAQQYRLGNVDSSFIKTKEEMSTKIKSMENSAASVLCSISSHTTQHNHFMEAIIGIVALLGSVDSPELSRMLAEYLGEDQMLDVICRSFNTAVSPETNKQNGEIDFVHALHAEAAGLGKAISKRFHVICFENIRRPYNGYLQDYDYQRKLALPDPKLPNRKTPTGFIGYAVNMIDLDAHHLQTRTTLGQGLRETVLYSLFKKLHVYNTRENMVAALACIEDGAISLDGGIIRENGSLSLGYGNPCIFFPCTKKLDISPEAMEILSQIEEKKECLLVIEELITPLRKYQNKFEKKEKSNSVMETILPDLNK